MTGSGRISKDAFKSAILKVEWADQHIGNIEELLGTIHDARPNVLSAKDDPQGERGVQLRLDFSPILAHVRVMQMMVGDAVHNLRTALDHLAYNIVSAFEKPPKYLYFPIDAELNSLIAQPSFRVIQRLAPDIADLIVSEIKPYGAGNPFVKLNQLDRADKHRLLLTHTITGKVHVYMSKNDDEVPDAAANSFILNPAEPTRTPLPGTKAAAHNKNYRGAAFDVCFDKGLPFENEPIVPTMHQLTQLVAGVISTLAAHCFGENGTGL